MTARPESIARGGSFLLELLYYAGWRLQVRDGSPVRIHATRDGFELDVTASTVSAAAGTVFARAMRSSRTSKAVNLPSRR